MLGQALLSLTSMRASSRTAGSSPGPPRGAPNAAEKVPLPPLRLSAALVPDVMVCVAKVEVVVFQKLRSLRPSVACIAGACTAAFARQLGTQPKLAVENGGLPLRRLGASR